MAPTPLATQKWHFAVARIERLPARARAGRPVTGTLRVAELDLTNAFVVWEARGQEPACGLRFTFTPRRAGRPWVEAEAQWPDGRRAFAATNLDCE